MTNKKKLLNLIMGCSCIVMLAQLSYAEEENGFRYNNLNVSPYVNLAYIYDTNVDYTANDEEDDHMFRVNPGVDLRYTGNDWGINATAFYSYDRYKDNERLNKPSYGENIDLYWESPRGLSFLLSQNYVNASQNDSITTDSGNGLWRDRNQFDITGALAYKVSEKTSVALTGQYSDMWYDNDPNAYRPLYGWTEASVGLELARQITAKSDLLLNGSYQQYESDGAQSTVASPVAPNSSSTGYSLMGGFGSRATERIDYRVLAGASAFNYAESDMLIGFTYDASLRWVLSRKFTLALAGASYFQPSERTANQATQAYSASIGLTYLTSRRLTTSLDLAYRREENEYQTVPVDSAVTDRYSVRLMARYKLRKNVSLYTSLEYEEQAADNDEDEFDRFRGTLGVNLRY
ncbi:MAG: outer membrane beta-barrel protein [Kiritimatiellae bacterium]|jgi:hypothetical protein|nr:outer membrane beta-barrel protein [Kiritimatiellia bacterium]